MSSFFYSRKTADTVAHPLPPSLDRECVLGLLHDETLLPRILWPNSVMENRQQTLSGLEGVLSDTYLNVSLLKLSDGVTCVEKLGGFTLTVSYSIMENDAPGKDGSKACGLQLQEERSLRALRPIASFTKFKPESPAKTQNLLRFFEALSRNGTDSLAALESIAIADLNKDKQKGD
ncbi:hypothetical protein LLEC1_04853 [Akanthomyces lecanii]|uniref:Uncharacterized protein n=1 Tax=Cordyceps confragosa TaxID=2714763 RepID=A0A179I0I2_CORDF|nr:hypothetical protein LLEC1_04853 [Akanthomyces lecanii]